MTKKYLVSIAALALVVGCQQGDSSDSADNGSNGQQAADTTLVDTATDAGAELTVTEGGFPSGESLNGIKEILPSDIKPTFTRETVIKLNAIVQTSLDTINAYDELRRTVKANPDRQSSQETIDALAEMDTVAKTALADMQAEVERLEASDEVYNEVVLAGMVRFVTDVEDEIGKTRTDGWSF